MIEKGEFGNMVAMKNNIITKIPLKEVAGKLKQVDPNSQLVQEAKEIGISFGD